MSNSPFRENAKKINQKKDYIRMQVDCDGVRSHSWWKNLVEYGAWQGPGNLRVGPPTPEAVPGIAKLFGTSKEEVCAMIAADWYGVNPNGDVSSRVRRLGPTLEALAEPDADLIEAFARRLARDGGGDRAAKGRSATAEADEEAYRLFEQAAGRGSASSSN